jgi:hypothetical protein
MLTTRSKKTQQLRKSLHPYLKKRQRPLAPRAAPIDLSRMLQQPRILEDIATVSREWGIIDAPKADHGSEWQEAYDMCIADCWYIQDASEKVKASLTIMEQAGLLAEPKTDTSPSFDGLASRYTPAELLAIQQYMDLAPDHIGSITSFFHASHTSHATQALLLQHVDKFIQLGKLPSYGARADWSALVDLATAPDLATLCFDHAQSIATFMLDEFMDFDDIISLGFVGATVLLPRWKQIEKLDDALCNEFDHWLDLVHEDPVKCARLLDNTATTLEQLEDGVAFKDLV